MGRLFAWYQAGTITQGYSNRRDATGFHTVTSSVTLGAFTITPVFTKEVSENVILTDNSGETYVYASGQTSSGQEIDAGLPGDAVKHAQMKIKLDVTYAGSLATKEEVNAVWQASAAAVDVVVSDQSGYDDGKGLKFQISEFAETSYTGAATITLEFSAANLKTASFAADPSDEDSNNATPNTVTARTTTELVFYVAVKGVNGVVQSNSDTYTVGALAQNHTAG